MAWHIHLVPSPMHVPTYYYCEVIGALDTDTKIEILDIGTFSTSVKNFKNETLCIKVSPEANSVSIMSKDEQVEKKKIYMIFFYFFE